MTKLIWLSDLHFTYAGEVLGHDPRIRLQAAIDHINANHSDATMCVITGDMVNRGTRADYDGVSEQLRGLPMPYLPMVGNHDNRDLVRQVLEVPDICMDDFIQFKTSTPDGLIVCLDTQKAGSDAGEFCEARKAWLRDVLAGAGDTPVYLFMHHPPMTLGLPMQDIDNMENGQEFLDIVSRFDCVRYMFIGHVHRPISGAIGRIGFSTMRSVLYQAPAPRPDWTWDTFKPSQEAPQFGVVEINDGAMTLHYETFCDYAVGTNTAESSDPFDC